MYTGSVLALTGVGLMRGTVAGLLSPALFVTILTRGQIAFEEAALEDAYGDDYVEYKRRVRRWL
jgi:protein-S-isoprenylcysteine O-methyltransferase Ste14